MGATSNPPATTINFTGGGGEGVMKFSWESKHLGHTWSTWLNTAVLCCCTSQPMADKYVLATDKRMT